MASSEATDDKQPSFDALLCDAALDKIPGIPVKHAANVRRSCQDDYENGGVTCKHPDFLDFVEEGEGFDIQAKKLKGNSITLPRYIVVPDRTASNLPLSIPETYMLGARIHDLVPSATRYVGGSLLYVNLPTIDTAYLGRSIFKGRSVLLFGSGPDPLLEGLNRDKEDIQLYTAIASMRFAAVTPADFSVNPGSCYAGQLANINRSLVAGRSLEEAGSEVIPNVYATDDYLLAEWTRFFNNRPYIRTISINCQLQRRRNDDTALVQRTVAHLIENVGHELHIILRGFPFTLEALEPILKYYARLHFADSVSFILPRNHSVFVFNSLEQKLWRQNYKAQNVTERVAMIEASIDARAAFLASLAGEKIPHKMSILPGTFKPHGAGLQLPPVGHRTGN